MCFIALIFLEGKRTQFEIVLDWLVLHDLLGSRLSSSEIDCILPVVLLPGVMFGKKVLDL